MTLFHFVRDILLLIFAYIVLGVIFQKTYDFINIAITNYRKKKHPELFLYIKSYNGLIDSRNEWLRKEVLPLQANIDDFYKNVRYYSKETFKQRELAVEHQKNLLEDARKNYQKICDNAQDYYLMIKDYAKSHKIKWTNKYLRS